jgi:GNAT superfamily N-acetyltransferase
MKVKERHLKTRVIGEDDILVLAEIYAETFNGPPWHDGWTVAAAKERIERMVIRPTGLGVVAETDGAVIGAALGDLCRWTDGEHFHLQEMFVRPQEQRRGVGSALMNELGKRLEEHNVRVIYLQTHPGSAAETFYAKHGYTATALLTMVRKCGR